MLRALSNGIKQAEVCQRFANFINKRSWGTSVKLGEALYSMYSGEVCGDTGGKRRGESKPERPERRSGKRIVAGTALRLEFQVH